MSPRLRELMLKRGLPVQAARPTARVLNQLLPWQAAQFSSDVCWPGLPTRLAELGGASEGPASQNPRACARRGCGLGRGAGGPASHRRVPGAPAQTAEPRGLLGQRT